jgi:hypothetical protein
MRYFKYFFLITSVIFAHIAVGNFLNYPFNQINILFLFLLWQIIVYRQIKNIYLLALIFGFFLDLFSVNPFGAHLSSMILAIIATEFVLRIFFTGRSIYIIFLSSLIGIIIYRLTFFSLLFILSIFTKDLIILNYNFFYNLFWEIFLNVGVIFLIYLITHQFIKALNPAYISLKRKKPYG